MSFTMNTPITHATKFHVSARTVSKKSRKPLHDQTRLVSHRLYRHCNSCEYVNCCLETTEDTQAATARVKLNVLEQMIVMVLLCHSSACGC